MSVSNEATGLIYWQALFSIFCKYLKSLAYIYIYKYIYICISIYKDELYMSVRPGIL